MKCGKCKAELRIAQEQIGVNEQNVPILKTFAYCDKCRTKYDYDDVSKKQKKKDSALSIWAAILSLFTCTCFIGAILGIVDLCINDKTKKHLGSWFAIVFFCLWLFVGLMVAVVGNDKKDEQLTGEVVQENIEAEPNEVIAEEVQPSEEMVIEYEQVSAETLLKTLEENSLRAETNYQDAYVQIAGELTVIDSDGSYIAITDGSFTFTSITCYVTDDSQLDAILQMNIGDNIVVKGQITDIGEVLGYMADIHEVEIVRE